MTHVITFEVYFKEYPGNTNTFTGNFEFTIVCPYEPTSVTVTQFDSTTKSIDLASSTPTIVKVPEIAF